MNFHDNPREQTDGNSFKEDDYLSYLMNNYKDEFYKQNKTSSYIQDIQDIKDKKLVFRDRGTEGIYMSHQVFEDWIFFCNTIPKSTCDLTEKALILFMLNYPKRDILIDLKIDELKEKTSQQQLHDSMLCSYLATWIEKISDLDIKGELNNNSPIWSRFLELCEEAVKINNPSPRLEKLMEEARRYI